jgi:hypothetical protein
LIAGFYILQVNEEVEALAREYFAALNMPEKAKIDAGAEDVTRYKRSSWCLHADCVYAGRVDGGVKDVERSDS